MRERERERERERSHMTKTIYVFFPAGPYRSTNALTHVKKSMVLPWF
jgi:hypothetical protein